ncbi:MAG: hypothetical protein WBV82_15190, partial [Myxococcaceae bacterium]
VKLVLAVGQHDRDYVDAFYGPAAWAEAAKASKLPLEEIRAQATGLSAQIEAVPEPSEELEKLRRRYLLRQLAALQTRVAILSGERLPFDEESQRIYDARSPALDEAQLQSALQALDAALPGEGPLDVRLANFRKQFEIPKDRIDPVFRAAIDEARRRTLVHLRLPANETFKLEYVTGKSWGGYNWYQGNATSLIQINTDLPIHPWRAVDLAAHEGYPGHHVYNVLLEKHLVRERGWVEFSVYPLFSPQSLIAEGSANYGIDVAFPDASEFARDVLFPLAGLDPAQAEAYVRVEELAGKLDYAGNEVARRYLDGVFTREQAKDWLVRYGLMSPERAEKRVAFIDTYRAYIINYNVGRDLVRAYVEGRGGTADAPKRRWDVLRDLLASPRLPSDLRAEERRP